MQKNPPVYATRNWLPFGDQHFSWEAFEEFFLSFLAAQPSIAICHEGKRSMRQIKSVRSVGRRGDKQNGIDLLADADGEVWAFQCKHYQKWTKARTIAALRACQTSLADHHFLLVTCGVGEDSRAAIEENSGWTLWDGGEITRQFLRLKPEREAAAILYRCFGPGWDQKFFAISGAGPLLTADAFFGPWRKTDRDFHHNLPFVGPKSLLDKLDRCVAGRAVRVVLIVGKGGIGKSRLLAEWSTRFSRRHRGVALLFASRESEDFESHLRASGERSVIVLDDAHQESSLRQQLFHAAVRLDGVQLVLALRPGPNESVRQELISAGYDTSDIEEFRPMERLSDDDALHLVREALGGSHQEYVETLYHASRDLPLIAVVMGSLIRRRVIDPADFSSHPAIRDLVFGQLAKQADQVVSQGFSPLEIREFLATVSLLSPVSDTSEFRRKVLSILSHGGHEHRVADLVQALEGCGVLLSGKSGLRIVPDLLSDHFAYAACYDGHGKAKGFARLIIDTFGEQSMEVIARHLAECEWRAEQEHERPESIIGPILELFETEFRAGSFYRRSELLRRWRQIAALRPRETLKFVELALAETNAPPEENLRQSQHEFVSSLDSHATVLDELPPLFRAVGLNCEPYVESALKGLWHLARTRDDDENRNENHPLTAMAAIGKYEVWKSPAICQAALRWMEHFFAGDQWLVAKPRAPIILQVLLRPFLGTWLDATLFMRRKALIRILPVSEAAVREMRGRIYAICRRVLDRRDPNVALAVLRLAEEGSQKLRPPYGGASTDDLEAEWLPQRCEALRLFADVLGAMDHPAIQLSARGTLRDYLRRSDAPGFRALCRDIFEGIPDTLELRTMRTLFSHAHDEFGEAFQSAKIDFNAGMAKEEEHWRQFVASVAAEIVQTFSTANAIADYLDRLAVRANEVGWQYPEFRRLLAALVAESRVVGRDLAQILLDDPEHRLASAFDVLVHQTTVGDPAKRLELYRSALRIDSQRLCASAIYGLSWWRSEESLPGEVWDLLNHVAESAQANVASAIAGFVDANATHAELLDLQLLARLPLPGDHPKIIARVLDALGSILATTQEPAATRAIGETLDRLVSITEIPETGFQHELSQLAEAAPFEVFSFLLARCLAAQEGRFSQPYHALPYWVEALPLFGLSKVPGYRELVEKLGEDSMAMAGAGADLELARLLRIALFTGNDHPEAMLDYLLSRADMPEKLKHLIRIFEPSGIAFAYPLWARNCLANARQFGHEVYDFVRDSLWRSCFSGGASFTNGEPNESTRKHLEALQMLAHRYAQEPEIGPLFLSAASAARHSIDQHKREFLREICEE